MSLLSRRRVAGSEPPGIPSEPRARPEKSPGDATFDTLASVLRVYGGNGFDVETT